MFQRQKAEIYLATKFLPLTISWTMMKKKKKRKWKSTKPELSSLARIQLPATAERKLKCKICSTSRASCLIPLMKRPLC